MGRRIRNKHVLLAFTLIVTLYFLHNLRIFSHKHTQHFYQNKRTVWKTTPSCISERQNFTFIKIMKCATESLAPMFRKFGYDRNLTYVLPVEDRIWIGWPFPFNQYDYRPSTKAYNILTEHSIYNKTMLSQLMPIDTIYISTIRQPFKRLKSVFNCFKIDKNCNMTEKTDPITEYLEKVENIPNYNCIGVYTDWRRYCPAVSFSQTHNEMSHSLGMPLGFPQGRANIEDNMDAVHEYIKQLDTNIHLIMIVEYLHESVILLKRQMCWTFKDIFYIKRNVADYSYKYTKLSESKLKFFKHWNRIDYLLYDYFNRTLWTKIQAESSDFFEEVAAYTRFRNEGEKYCLWKEYTNKELPDLYYFKETKWSVGFSITAVDCQLLLSDMLQNLKDVYDIHERQHHPAPDLKTCHL